MEEYDHSNFTKPGAPCWLEIPVLDLSRAKTFYTKLFNWEFIEPKTMGMPDDGTYLIFSKKGTAAHGGLQLVKPPGKLIAPASSSPQQANSDHDGTTTTTTTDTEEMAVRISFTVESIEESLKVVEEAGGKVVLTKTSIGKNMGSKAHLRDTEGNVMGLFESDS